MAFAVAEEMSVDEARVNVDEHIKIPLGAYVGIYGPSGSGKSTILRRLIREQRVFFNFTPSQIVIYTVFPEEPELLRLQQELGGEKE